MNFEVGQTYEMKTRGIDRDSNGYDYIALVSDDKGDEKKDYRVYNFMKGFYEELPHTIPVAVYYIDAFGQVKFRQNTPQILQEHYEIGKMYTFRITGTDTDSNGKSYYSIEDKFAIQRYYYLGEPKHQIGDNLVLEVSGIASSGYLCYKEAKTNNIAPAPAAYVQRTDGNGRYYAPYGPESKTVEYKTSIVFTPDGNSNIDEQIRNIVKALTAMMNAEGGKLIIGVHDKTREILGVEKDYPHLNDGYIDKYASQYPPNDEGYKRKILNSVRYLSGTYAGSLLKIDRKAKGGKDYYVVEITKADRPIWMRTKEQGTILFQRQDGSSEPLWGDELSQFVFDRMRSNKRYFAGSIPPVPTREVDYWVVWNAQGEWRRQRKKATSCYVQLPVYKNMSKPVLLLCYKDAKRVAAMNWTEMRRGVNMNITQPSLWNTPEVPEMFIAETTDYLAICSVDHNGTEYQKILAIGDFTLKTTPGIKGVEISPENTNVISFRLIDKQYFADVKDLRITKEFGKNLGTPINTESEPLAKQINYLMSIPKPQIP